MDTSRQPTPPPGTHGGQLLIDLLRFQVKLLVDAARDLVLVPLALLAAALDLLLVKRQSPRYFYRLLQWGERSERLIDLWSVLYQRLGPGPTRIDSVIDGVEAAIRDPALGKRRARVLKRWLTRQLHRQQRRAAASPTPPNTP
jgi:hypothetical protein